MVWKRKKIDSVIILCIKHIVGYHQNKTQLKCEENSITKSNIIVSVSIENVICTKQAEELPHGLCQHHETLLEQQFS